jgi:hypothetical protein
MFSHLENSFMKIDSCTTVSFPSSSLKSRNKTLPISSQNYDKLWLKLTCGNSIRPISALLCVNFLYVYVLWRMSSTQTSARRVFTSHCWAATAGPMGCLRGNDVVRDVTIKAVFSVGPCFASCCATDAKLPPTRRTQFSYSVVLRCIPILVVLSWLWTDPCRPRSRSKLFYDRRSVGQSYLGFKHLFGT